MTYFLQWGNTYSNKFTPPVVSLPMSLRGPLSFKTPHLASHIAVQLLLWASSFSPNLNSLLLFCLPYFGPSLLVPCSVNASVNEACLWWSVFMAWRKLVISEEGTLTEKQSHPIGHFLYLITGATPGQAILGCIIKEDKQAVRNKSMKSFPP